MTATRESFAEHFAALKPLIVAEWPAVDAAALEATRGDRAEVVELVVTSTEQDREVVERQLRELGEVAAAGDPPPSPPATAPFHEALQTLQAKMNEATAYIRDKMLTEANQRGRDHFLLTLALAIGLGFILGFVLRGLGRGRS
jgi:hypothetical protein